MNGDEIEDDSASQLSGSVTFTIDLLEEVSPGSTGPLGKASPYSGITGDLISEGSDGLTSREVGDVLSRAGGAWAGYELGKQTGDSKRRVRACTHHFPLTPPKMAREITQQA